MSDQAERDLWQKREVAKKEAENEKMYYALLMHWEEQDGLAEIDEEEQTP